MSLSGSVTRIWVLPLWRRNWAYHCAGSLEKSPPPSNWFARFKANAWERAAAKWTALKSAQGGIQGMIRRVAERLVDQVPPEESFLSAIAGASSATGRRRILVHYPSSVSAKLVRKRLMLLTKASRWHQRWSYFWGAATPLLFPLIISPISNIPIVYTGWRWYAHRTAAKGADILADASLEFEPCDGPLDDLAKRAWSDQPISPDDADPPEMSESVDRKLRWLRARGDIPTPSGDESGVR